MQKNEVCEIEITGITNEGNGVGRADGYTLFVPDTAPGDLCRVRLVKCEKRYGYGRLEELLSPSPDRVEPDCPVAGPCGGCCFRHLSYASELRIKEGFVRDAFARVGGIAAPMEPILGSKRINGCRNKAQYPFGTEANGRLTVGFYAKRSHRLIGNGECALAPALFGEWIRASLDWLSQRGFSAWNETAGTGSLRHLYLRLAEATGEGMVCVVAAQNEQERLAGFGAWLAERFPAVKSVVFNHNPARTNVILGRECVTLWGGDTITDRLCGVSVELSPLSFYQVNHDQAERLYETAFQYACISSEDTLLDLYCGVGAIGLAAAGRARSVIGVEIVPEAVENARANARNNGIQNARFLCADAGEAAAQLAAEGIRPDVILVDPPRKGLDAAVIDAIAAMSPERLVMISCNPATAARDCARLRERGYAVSRIAPVDLFPRTAHVETCVLLSHKNPQTSPPSL